MYKYCRSNVKVSKGTINKEVKKLKMRKKEKSFNTRPYFFSLHSIETFQVLYTRNWYETYNFKDEVPKHIKNLPEYQAHLKSYQAYSKFKALEQFREELHKKFKFQHFKPSYHRSISRSYNLQISSKSAFDAEFESISTMY